MFRQKREMTFKDRVLLFLIAFAMLLLINFTNPTRVFLKSEEPKTVTAYYYETNHQKTKKVYKDVVSVTGKENTGYRDIKYHYTFTFSDGTTDTLVVDDRADIIIEEDNSAIKSNKTTEKINVSQRK